MSGLVDLSPGAVFAEQFRVVRPLARGGMGAVYVVEQLGTARERALKLMHPQIASDAKSIERFQREAQVASKIDSDHVVEVIAAGVDAKTSTPWLCMELLKGETLADRVEKSGRPSRADTLEVIKQLGHALGAAHRAGIVHRDLKPENVFLATPRREGVPFTLKVLDFGVAALVADAKGAKTTQGVGSPMWMAPEQTDTGRITTATDVWALGLMAFYLLTGKTYWKSPTVENSTLTALLVEMMVEPMPPASVRAHELLAGGLVPSGFDAWFARAVDRDPSKRFPDASAALPELIAVLENAPVAVASAFAATTPMAAAPATRPSARDATAAVAEPPTPASGTRLWLASGLGLIALVGIGGVASMMDGGPPSTTAIGGPPSTPIVAIAAVTDAAIPATTVASDDDSDDEDESDDNDDNDDEDDQDEDESDDNDDEDRTSPAPAPARHVARAAPSSGPAAAARRMLLDVCWRDTFEGEPPPPPARWTFDFVLDESGHADNVRITGPSDGDYAHFRQCVVTRVDQYRPTDGTTHVSLTLP